MQGEAKRIAARDWSKALAAGLGVLTVALMAMGWALSARLDEAQARVNAVVQKAFYETCELTEAMGVNLRKLQVASEAGQIQQLLGEIAREDVYKRQLGYGSILLSSCLAPFRRPRRSSSERPRSLPANGTSSMAICLHSYQIFPFMILLTSAITCRAGSASFARSFAIFQCLQSLHYHFHGLVC